MKITSSVDFDCALQWVNYPLLTKFSTFKVVPFVEFLDDRVLNDFLFLCDKPNVPSCEFNLLDLGLKFCDILTSFIVLLLLISKVGIDVLRIPNPQVTSLVYTSIIVLSELYVD